MTPGTTFVLVNNGRSGSTLLADLLRSHPAIDCRDEILNESRWQGWRWPAGWLLRAWPAPYLERQAGRSARPVFGFKLKTGGQVHDLGRTLYSLHRRGWRLIYLHRRDALQQTFSWCVAEASGRWQTTAGQSAVTQDAVTLDVDAFMRALRSCVQDRQTLADLMCELPHLPLVYEDDLQSSDLWPATGARVCAWLGVVPAPLTSRFLKTWDRPYADLVTNYDEIIAAVAVSPFRHLVAAPMAGGLALTEAGA